MAEKEGAPAKGESRAVQLHDNGLKAGSLIEQSLNNLTPEQQRALMNKAGEEALRLEVKRAEQHIEYEGGKKALEDHIDAHNMLNKDGKLTRHALKSEINTGAGKMTVESKTGAVCFVATTVYGYPQHPDVESLRQFRDRILTKSARGQRFIEWYWRNGPSLSDWLRHHAWARPIVRLCLVIVTRLIRPFL